MLCHLYCNFNIITILSLHQEKVTAALKAHFRWTLKILVFPQSPVVHQSQHCERDYLKNTWHKRLLGLRDELIRIRWSKVKFTVMSVTTL